MALQTVRMGYGKATLARTNGSFSVIRVKPSFHKESGITTGQRRAGTHIATPVSRHPQINGYMHTDDVAHEDGTIIMLQGMRSSGPRRIADAAILLRLREEGARLSIIGKLPIGNENLIGDNWEVFRGRADILSPDDAALYQVNIPRNFVGAFFDPEEVATLFEVFQLDPARTPKPEVALVSTATGLVTKEVAQSAIRRLRFRK